MINYNIDLYATERNPVLSMDIPRSFFGDGRNFTLSTDNAEQRFIRKYDEDGFLISPDHSPLTIRLKKRKKHYRMTVSIDFSRARSVEDILEAIKIYNTFIGGNVRLNNHELNKIKHSERYEYISDDIVDFWRQVKAIEDKIKEYRPDFKFEDFSLFDENDQKMFETVMNLYDGLIEDCPVMLNSRVEKNIFGIYNDEDRIGLLASRFYPATFIHSELENIELFGSKIDVLFQHIFADVLAKDVLLDRENHYYTIIPLQGLKVKSSEYHKYTLPEQYPEPLTGEKFDDVSLRVLMKH